MRLIRTIDVPQPIEKWRFSADGAFIAVSWFNTVKIYEFGSGKEHFSATPNPVIFHFAFSFSNEQFGVIAFNDRGTPDGKEVIAHIYSLPTGKEIIRRSLALNTASIGFNKDSSLIIIGEFNDGGEDYAKIRIFDSQINQQIEAFEYLNDDFAAHLEISHKANILVSTGIGVAIWDLTNYSLMWNSLLDQEFGTHTSVSEPSCFSLTPDGQYLAVGYDIWNVTHDEKAFVFSIPENKIIGWYCKTDQFVKSISISSDGQYLATVVEGETIVRVWKVDSGELVDEMAFEEVTSLAFAPNDDSLVICTGQSFLVYNLF